MPPTIFDKPLKYPANAGEYGVQAERPLSDVEQTAYYFSEPYQGWRFLVTKDGQPLGHVPAYITQSLVTTLERNTFSDPVNEGALAKTLGLAILQKIEGGECDFETDEAGRLTELSTYYDPSLATGISIRDLQELIKSKLSSEPSN